MANRAPRPQQVRANEAFAHVMLIEYGTRMELYATTINGVRYDEFEDDGYCGCGLCDPAAAAAEDLQYEIEAAYRQLGAQLSGVEYESDWYESRLISGRLQMERLEYANRAYSMIHTRAEAAATGRVTWTRDWRVAA